MRPSSLCPPANTPILRGLVPTQDRSEEGEHAGPSVDSRPLRGLNGTAADECTRRCRRERYVRNSQEVPNLGITQMLGPESETARGVHADDHCARMYIRPPFAILAS